MASSVKKIAEQVRRILGRRTADSDIDDREIELNVRQTVSYVVRARVFESKNLDFLEIPDSLIMSFRNIEIEKDGDINQFFATMPVVPMELPYGLGIKAVSPQKDLSCSFYRMPNGYDSIACGLESACIPGKVYYYQEGKKLYFPNMSQEDKPDKLLVRLVAPAEDVPGNDLEVPGDMELEVLSKVLEIYGIFRPEDEINDQNDIV